MIELPPTEFDQAASVFAPLMDRTPVAATLAGRTPGRVFIDAANRAAFIWNEFRYSYLVGDPTNAAIIENLRRLLHEELIPPARRSTDPTLVIYPHPVAWRQHLKQLFRAMHLTRAARRRFAFDPDRFQPVEALPPGLRLHRIDATLVETIPRLQADIELFWTSRELFLREGFGFCVLEGQQLASVCFAPCVGGGRAEVDIFTAPGYRRRGLARVAASAFIRHSLDANLVPNWECWSDNTASARLARSLGYRPLDDHPVVFINLLQWL